MGTGLSVTQGLWASDIGAPEQCEKVMALTFSLWGCWAGAAWLLCSGFQKSICQPLFWISHLLQDKNKTKTVLRVSFLLHQSRRTAVHTPAALCFRNGSTHCLCAFLDPKSSCGSLSGPAFSPRAEDSEAGKGKVSPLGPQLRDG